MAELTFIDWNTSRILEEIKAEFKTQSGNELEIGSNEMAIAATVSYILGVAKDRFNEMAKQRFITTATGYYLDAHAANLGIPERPKHAKATCVIIVANTNETSVLLRKNTFIIQDENGHKFTPKYDATASAASFSHVLFESLTDDVGNNDIAVGKINQVASGSIQGVSVMNSEQPHGANPEPYPYTDEGDNAFRKYIFETFESASNAGSNAAYMSIALKSDSRVKSVYILKTGDAGFVAGKVKVYFTSDIDLPDDELEKQLLILGMRQSVEDAIDASDARPVNDIVLTPSWADAHEITTHGYDVYYDKNRYQWAYIKTIVDKARDKYCKYLRANIGMRFYIGDLFSYIRNEEGGDAVRYILPSPSCPDVIQPEPWEVAIDVENVLMNDGIEDDSV